MPKKRPPNRVSAVGFACARMRDTILNASILERFRAVQTRAKATLGGLEKMANLQAVCA